MATRHAMSVVVGKSVANFAENAGWELKAEVDYGTVVQASADAIDRKLDGGNIELTTDRGAKIRGEVHTL